MKAKKIAATIGLSTLLIGGLLYGTLSNSSNAHSLSVNNPSSQLIDAKQEVSEDLLATVEVTRNTPDLMEVKTTQNNSVYTTQFKLVEAHTYTLISTNMWSDGEEDYGSAIVELSPDFEIEEYASLLKDTYDAIYEIDHSVRVLGDEYFKTEKYIEDLKRNDETNQAFFIYKSEHMTSNVSEDLLATVEVTSNTPDLIEVRTIQNKSEYTSQFKLMEDQTYTLFNTNVWSDGEVEESEGVKVELSPNFDVYEYAGLLQNTYDAIYEIDHSVRVLGDKYFETEKHEIDLKNNDETNQSFIKYKTEHINLVD
ncbi:hypothetical protein [Chengkuizengella axinellae]|uniref:DUF4179 domain-containing protein n=1 Tax=Chengkuizengella axinellae TaxID=3064388 RepID=A0ABT9ITG9_9BACL|nr:hypothetical protein [Chengkuizengella sp. 2205SS18-9]MDP5272649.1 hypothetical protein [Chengkuizengella sp. 2205SS18-9]